MKGFEKISKKVEKQNIPPEQIHVLHVYAITINLAKVSGHPLADFEEYFKMFHHLTKNLNLVLAIRPELSKKGRLHYHGTIQFLDSASIIQFYYNTYFKQSIQQSVNLLIGIIGDFNSWDIYCKKQRLHMKAFCQSLNLKYYYHKLI